MFMFIHHTACKKLKEIKIEIDSFIVLIYSTTTVQQYKQHTMRLTNVISGFQVIK